MANEEKINLMKMLSLEIFKLNGLLMDEGARMTDDINITNSRWRILGALVRATQPMTVPFLAREMGQARQSTQRMVDIMIKDGLLEYSDNPAHATSKCINLSHKGGQVYESLADRQQAVLASMSATLDTDQLRQAADTLKKLIDRLDASTAG